MKNSQQHLGNEANVTLRKNINLFSQPTFLLSRDVIFLMVSPLLGRFLVSFNLQSAVYGLQSAVFGLQSAVCSLQPANVIHRFQGSLPRLYTICILHQNLPSWTALVRSNTPTFKLYLRIMRFLGLWLLYNDLIQFLSLILLNCVFISKIKRWLYE